jgi:hypothetical protein
MTLPILLVGPMQEKKSAAAAGKIIINHTLSRIYIGKELVWAFSPLFCALAFLFVRAPYHHLALLTKP